MPIEHFNGGHVLTGKQTIGWYAWLHLEKGLEFEVKTGMKLVRGPSCSAVAKKKLGLPRSMRKADVLQHVQKHVEELRKRALIENSPFVPEYN